MIAYYGGNQPNSHEEGMAQMEKWKSWVARLGDKVINHGTPLPSSKLVTLTSVADDKRWNNSSLSNDGNNVGVLGQKASSGQ